MKMAFSCSYCCFKSQKWRILLRHTFECHSSAPTFLFNCPALGCSQSFRTFSGISSHIVRKHPRFNFSMQVSTSQSDLVSNDFEISNMNSEVQCMLDGDSMEHGNAVELNIPTFTNQQKSAALFILTLKERYCITQVALDFAIGQVKEMVGYIMDDVKLNLQQQLTNECLDIEQIFDHSKIFDGLNTEYLQQKFYRQHFGLVEPLTIDVGTTLGVHGSQRQISTKPDTFQYVPLLLGLKTLLQKKEIFDEVSQLHRRSDDLIEDVCDGEFFKSHPLYQMHETALQLLCYFDEIEVCNPLAGVSGVHKLGMFYYTLANLRPELRSTHRAIQLLICTPCSLLDKYGFQPILSPFINDVNVLAQEGISVTVEGVTKTFYGSVIFFSADTLAAHQLGGFKVGVGFSLRKCRDCMATETDIQSKFTEEEFVLRTPTTYDYHCSLLNGPMASNDSTTYGVNYNSPLNEIDYFHVANMQLPQDVMHILFEGVIPMEIKLLVTRLIQQKFFTIETLNERCKYFMYSRAESKSKPPKDFKEKHFSDPSKKLPLSASQMWNFAVYLPFIIGDKVPEGNEMWECFLLLLDITKVCTSRITSVSLANYLTVLIEQHHRLFISCYPGINLTPKFHYLIHFPRLLKHIGPLVSSWCMRMEAKHSYFKKCAQISNCFKNIAYTVANRHQRLVCALLQGKFFSYNDLECGPCKQGGTTPLLEDPLYQQILFHLPNVDLESFVTRPNWVNIYGCKFYSSEYIHCGWQDDDLPQFGKIKDIVVVSNHPLLFVELFQTTGINSHILAYQITSLYSFSLIMLSSLTNKYSFSAHTYIADSNLYIAVKSHDVMKKTF